MLKQKKNDLISEWELKEELDLYEKCRIATLEDELSINYAFKINFPFEDLVRGNRIKFKEGEAIFITKSRIDGFPIFKFDKLLDE
jgi:hypothetical protein